MFTLWRSFGNELETTFDPECTALVGRTSPESAEYVPNFGANYIKLGGKLEFSDLWGSSGST